MKDMLPGLLADALLTAQTFLFRMEFESANSGTAFTTAEFTNFEKLVDETEVS